MVANHHRRFGTPDFTSGEVLNFLLDEDGLIEDALE